MTGTIVPTGSILRGFAVVEFVCLLLLLGFALPASGADVQPKKSIFLVAKKDLPDPNFRDTVVLVTNYGGPTPVGVIVNRPTQIPLAKVFPDIERLRSREEKLFFGGPVRRQELVVAFRAAVPPPGGTEILDGVYMSSSSKLMRELLGRESPVDGLRVFAGHAGWGPGQLESEIARGNWHLTRADARTIFEKKPESLWQELERRASATIALRTRSREDPAAGLWDELPSGDTSGQARSRSSVTPFSSAQWSQQNIRPAFSSPWPMMRIPQCSQVGASLWIAHSKLSKVCVLPAATTWNVLS